MSSTSIAITVSELTFAIKNQLESKFLKLIVQGEISNCKLHSSGHLYFDLKDAGSKISAVMFRADIKEIPKEGDHVMVHGAISVYPPHGKYQLLVKKMEYAGIGKLLLKLEELKKKLQTLGWFDPERKKPLPKFPKRIGVVTSPTGAVIRDIINVLSRRLSGFHLILNPVRVQGEGAASEIAAALEVLNKYNLVDVIIVARGGGSIEDLWPFNEEIVAKAIFESKIPVISAVGHETDFTIADFVADVRAPTPSAAAEIVSSETKQQLEYLEKVKKTLAQPLFNLKTRLKIQLERYIKHPLLASPYGILGPQIQRLDELKGRLDVKIRQEFLKKRYLLMAYKKESFALKPTAKIEKMKQELTGFEKRLSSLSSNYLVFKKQELKEIVQNLKALDPKNVLKRGYSILFAVNKDSVIVSASEVSSGDLVIAKLSDGDVYLRVDHE